MADILDAYYTGGTGAADEIIHYSVALESEIGQGFTPGTTGPCSKIEIDVKKLGSPTGNISLEIRTDTAGIPSSTVLATSAAIDASTISGTTSYVAFTFPTQPTLTASTLYHITTLCTYAYSAGVNNIMWNVNNATGTTHSWNVNGTWTNQATKTGNFKQYYNNTPTSTSNFMAFF